MGLAKVTNFRSINRPCGINFIDCFMTTVCPQPTGQLAYRFGCGSDSFTPRLHYSPRSIYSLHATNPIQFPEPNIKKLRGNSETFTYQWKLSTLPKKLGWENIKRCNLGRESRNGALEKLFKYR